MQFVNSNMHPQHINGNLPIAVCEPLNTLSKSYIPTPSCQHPLTPSLDEFVQHHADVVEYKPADVEPEEFRRMPCTELQSHVRR